MFDLRCDLFVAAKFLSALIRALAGALGLLVCSAAGAGNSPPTVSLSEPVDGQTLAGLPGVSIVAVANDEDGEVVKVEFFAGDIKLMEFSRAPYRILWSTPPGGTHKLTAKATDIAGAVSSSTVVSVTVIPAASITANHGFEAAEGYPVGPFRQQAVWRATGNRVEVTSSAAHEGKHSMVILPHVPGSTAGPASLVLGITMPDQKARYIDFWIKPVADGQSSSFSVSPHQSILFYRRMKSAAMISTYIDEGTDDTRYSRRSIAVDASGRATEWHRITIREDLVYGGMDVYLDGHIALDGLRFSSGQNRFELKGHPRQPTYLDNFRILADNPLFADTDHDGMDDAWEITHGLDPAVNDRSADKDRDGLANIKEYVLRTHPGRADSDGDGLDDMWETKHGSNPLASGSEAASNLDLDGDGLSTLAEAQAGTDDREADTDGDGISDKIEVAAGWNPLEPSKDVDGDGVSNEAEVTRGTDPVDYYNGVSPVVTSLVPSDGTLLEGGSIALRITNSAGEPFVNAPVTFTANSAEFGYSPTLENKHARARISVRVRTDDSGIARVYVVRADELLEPLR